MDIVIVLFEGITALDAVGPYEVLSRLYGARLRFVGPRTGLVRTDNAVLGMQVDASFDEVRGADVLVVPGGFGVRPLCEDPRTLDWLRRASEGAAWTTSVCTGSLLLGAAGLLEGRRATTHWAYLEELRALGATPVAERVVRDGDLMTAAGVSAGVDMALCLTAELSGEEVARGIQLALEYDPDPPFDGGSVAKTPAPIVERVRALLASR